VPLYPTERHSLLDGLDLHLDDVAHARYALAVLLRRILLALMPLTLLVGCVNFGRECEAIWETQGDVPLKSFDAGADSAPLASGAALPCKAICPLSPNQVRCSLDDAGTTVHCESLDNVCPQ
jgi:hypothetical protein